tara:strand:- start:574 stop:840 length:267 start_codon:yes stop_codon:yes gene_type:complete
MADLSNLFNALGDGDETTDAEYDTARLYKVREIERYVSFYLKDPGIAPAIAEDIMASAEESGRFDGDAVNGEVPSRYTITGNPLSLTI